jgi:hypothetical protein
MKYEELRKLCTDKNLKIPNHLPSGQKGAICCFLLLLEHSGIIQRIPGNPPEIQVQKSQRHIFNSKLISLFPESTDGIQSSECPGSSSSVQNALTRYGLHPKEKGIGKRDIWPNACNGDLNFIDSSNFEARRKKRRHK